MSLKSSITTAERLVLPSKEPTLISTDLATPAIGCAAEFIAFTHPTPFLQQKPKSLYFDARKVVVSSSSINYDTDRLAMILYINEHQPFLLRILGLCFFFRMAPN
ncbi:UNVERIFIED_CONTAM: hypothetical protein Slati_3168200 [Sesamum latifolium]|uniref:Uncharacterized protein n=1 Tax=Sesamum latifolium TaxID=2727402 RepID=A0AAW2UXJ1_9LAMI